MTGFAKRGLIRTIINTEKPCFEILIIVYLENAWCLVYKILHQSIVIQGNSAGALFDGLLAELPTILDDFFTSTTSDYIGVVGRGWRGATKWQGKHTLRSYTCCKDPLVLEWAQKVVKTEDNITTSLCKTSQPGSLVEQPAETAEHKPGMLLTVHAVLSFQLTMLFLVRRVAYPLCNTMKSEISLQTY